MITKALFALKTRNAMIFLPHPKTAFATSEAVRICCEAAIAAGAPANILQCVNPNREVSTHVMKHPNINLLVATGGPSMVAACYGSGKPAMGVGAGNAAVLVDATADLDEVVGSVVLSKTFDNGVICASEQSAVIVDSVYDTVKAKFIERGVHFVEGDNRQRLSDFLIKQGHINPDVVGQSALEIAARAGIKGVPSDAVVLAAEVSEVGVQEPLSYEKLSPLLSFYRAKDFEHGCDISKRIVEFGGKGHTAAIYTEDRAHMLRFAELMPAFHLMCNMPTAFGAIGTAFNFHVDPSMTLGVGAIGGSSLSGSLTPFHLLDIKTLAERQEHMEWVKNPPALYFNRNCTEEALEDLARRGRCSRVLIVTDKTMNTLGHVHRVVSALQGHGLECSVFDDVSPDPNLDCVRAGVSACERFRPDTLVCLGGGSPMDAGKLIRVLYENPEVAIDDLAARFVELRKRTFEFPGHGKLVHTVVCIPTTSGTASEVTPFSVITDDDGTKLPLFSYDMTPDIAIVDASYTTQLPSDLVAHAGLDAITHAVESYVSVCANDFSKPMSKRALKLLIDNLAASFHTGDEAARERVHHGSTIAGLAFSNSFLGVCHSLSHQVGAQFHLPHGLVNAILLPYVMEYNASPNPTRMTAYPTYSHPQSLQRYAELAHHLDLKGDSNEILSSHLVDKLQALNSELKVPNCFKELGIDEHIFMDLLPAMAIGAFDDQCSGANPRFPLAKELEELLLKSYHGGKIQFKF